MKIEALNLFFGFEKWPFSISPDPNAVFWSGQHRSALAQLRSGIENNTALMLFSGEVGTGKTTVIRHLMDNSDEHILFAQLLNPLIPFDELLAEICAEFNCLDDATGHFKALQNFLHQCDQNGKRPVLIIDEAQHLSFEALEQLRLLTNIETDEKKLISVVLVGQPELREVIQQPRLRQLSQRIGARPHLSMLTESETREYIQVRLQLSGKANTEQLFRAGSIKEIFYLTEGTPRKINAVVSEALKIAHGDSSTVVNKVHVTAAAQSVLDWVPPKRTMPVLSSRFNWQTASALTVILGTLGYIGFNNYGQLQQRFFAAEQTAELIDTTPSEQQTAAKVTQQVAEQPVAAPEKVSKSLIKDQRELTWAELPNLLEASREVQETVGAIDYAAHVYAGETGKGFALINRDRKKPGSFIGQARVEKLDEKGLILSLDGQRFKLPALKSLGSY